MKEKVLGNDIRSEAPRERTDRQQDHPHPGYAPARMVLLRNTALMRVREMSSRHGMHAFEERRGADAIGPHAIAYLYHDTERRPGVPTQDTVRAATRLFRDSDEVRDLPRLLHTVAGIAQRYSRRGAFDPRRTMVRRSDDMTPSARYLGVAVSSLDTPAGRWNEARDRARSALELAGRSYLHLVDDTRVMLDRGGSFGVIGATQSTAALEVANVANVANRNWQPLHLHPGDPTEEVWAALEALHLRAAQGIQEPAARYLRARDRLAGYP